MPLIKDEMKKANQKHEADKSFFFDASLPLTHSARENFENLALQKKLNTQL